ncbi:MAG: hypothetical protein Q8N98_00040 [bacterium]|nr:hypothetical protein [bacterium]
MFVRVTQNLVGESIVLKGVNIRGIRPGNSLIVRRAERKYTKHKGHCVIQKAESTFAINPVSRFGKIVIFSSAKIIPAGKTDKVLIEK